MQNSPYESYRRKKVEDAIVNEVEVFENEENPKAEEDTNYQENYLSLFVSGVLLHQKAAAVCKEC